MKQTNQLPIEDFMKQRRQANFLAQQIEKQKNALKVAEQFSKKLTPTKIEEIAVEEDESFKFDEECKGYKKQLEEEKEQLRKSEELLKKSQELLKNSPELQNSPKALNDFNSNQRDDNFRPNGLTPLVARINQSSNNPTKEEPQIIYSTPSSDNFKKSPTFTRIVGFSKTSIMR